MLVVFAPSFLNIWNGIKSMNNSWDVLHVNLPWYDRICMLWINISKSRSDFLKNFLAFGFVTFEKQGVINLSSYGCKRYAFIVREKMLFFVHSPLYHRRGMPSNFHVFYPSGGISSKSSIFLLFILFNTVISPFSFNCSSQLLIFFSWFISDFSAFLQRFL